MQQVKSGDLVRIHYHGTLSDGTVFDSSSEREPLEFTAGSGQVIPGFDTAVVGMTVGEKKSVHIPVDEAYGQPNDQMMIEFPKSQFPEDVQPEVGASLHLSDDQGHVFPVTVVEVKEDSVVLDGNHPLAGKDLNFDLELVSIG
ncbi:MAG: peptidylprolyl isomerase [Sphingobacteriales bacterium]|nr:MAG: peptidylprolyl isomerase [Sphingobacteriales bacterium]